MIKVLISALTIWMLSACTTAPRQTVELADTVNQQIASMEASHEAFVRLYYQGLRKDVDEFMAHTWTPRFLSNVITGAGASSQQFRESLDRGYALANVDWRSAVRIEGISDSQTEESIRAAIDDVAVRSRGELGRVLIDFSNAAQKEIELQRRQLLDPIDQQEAFVLGELRSGYADLLAGSAAIKGYLASVVKLAESRDAISQKLGLFEKQQALMKSALKLNDEVLGDLNASKGDVSASADKLKKWLSAVRDKVKK
jgi:hypothetical protein